MEGLEIRGVSNERALKERLAFRQAKAGTAGFAKRISCCRTSVRNPGRPDAEHFYCKQMRGRRRAGRSLPVQKKHAWRLKEKDSFCASQKEADEEDGKVNL